MDTATRDKIAIYFNYGSEDFLAAGAEQNFQEFGALGFTTDRLVHQGAGHCEHPIDAPTLEFWDRHLWGAAGCRGVLTAARPSWCGARSLA